eukprot:CAMPEP_0181180568 /NCGR_PEP_ID=MMETSP1096-20121128/6870_1 /TAXON_ID=156174 ORGANISM="Chrysochromulina ericina, Strain CCMP281" /NCGR_SAMPLE_ID=MMETSP1096 /ASSEMBLY_ACC=CAM_ASM_000453 /LENGTH=121 /DNA_ID=CAMNT_0023269007 /DNA_START=304 /DNA_END=666 /DNA_ORIENTATION=-
MDELRPHHRPMPTPLPLGVDQKDLLGKLRLLYDGQFKVRRVLAAVEERVGRYDWFVRVLLANVDPQVGVGLEAWAVRGGHRDAQPVAFVEDIACVPAIDFDAVDLPGHDGRWRDGPERVPS